MSTQEVNAWFQKYDSPVKAEMLAVRAILMAADKRMEECIKWQSPTLTFAGNLASFNPRAKKHVSLMFHTGAHIPGNFPHLEGGGGTAKYMTFADMNQVQERKKELEAIVHAWIKLKSAGTPGKAAPKKAKTAAKKKAPAKKKTTTKKKTVKKTAGKTAKQARKKARKKSKQ